MRDGRVIIGIVFRAKLASFRTISMQSEVAAPQASLKH